MNEIENKLWRKVDQFCDVLHMIPFLRMVAVCNNLSFGQVDEKSDIDLFIVARKGRLFFVRTFVTVLFHLLGVRRHSDKIAGRFCLSFFVDDESLDLSTIAIEDDIYLACWVKHMVVVLDHGVSKDFFGSNSWVLDYFDDRPVLGGFHLVSSNIALDSFKSILFAIFSGRFGDFIEQFLSNWQIKRALNKKSKLSDSSGIVVCHGILKFHNLDRRVYYRDLWRKKFGNKKLTEHACLSLHS